MKLYAPSYYKKFKCIADKCSHSCCIGWEIDIDPDTYEKYENLTCEYGEKIRASIEISDTPCFKLQKNDRCPHLDSRGLCKIITHLGEEYLCEICREHPRFYNFTTQGCEVGLGMACEEACRIILDTDAEVSLTEIGELDGEPDAEAFDTLALRKTVLEPFCSDKSYDKCANELCDKIGISYTAFDISKWSSIICDLEYLDPLHKELFLSTQGANKCSDQQLKRAFCYFVNRHAASAFDPCEFYRCLCFALFCVSLLRHVSSVLGDSYVAARIVSEEIEYSTDNTEAIKQAFEF